MYAYLLAFASTFLTAFSYGFGYLWTGFCLCASYYGYILYEVKNKEKVMSLIGKNKWSEMKDDNYKSRGFVIGYGYIGRISNNDKEQMAYIMCKPDIFKNLIETVCLNKESEKIDLYDRTGNYFWLDYDKRELIVDKYFSNKKQSVIIEEIIGLYGCIRNFVVLIHGGPGSGKSMCSILLAKHLKGSLVRTFNPTDPGDNLASLYATVQPTEDKPLILVLDEVDTLYKKVHNNLIAQHKHIPIQIYDKTTLNRFFDDINLGLYPNVIILMTSNISPEDIEKQYDPSFIREGRVDMKFHLEKEDICEVHEIIETEKKGTKLRKISKFLKSILYKKCL